MYNEVHFVERVLSNQISKFILARFLRGSFLPDVNLMGLEASLRPYTWLHKCRSLFWGVKDEEGLLGLWRHYVHNTPVTVKVQTTDYLIVKSDILYILFPFPFCT